MVKITVFEDDDPGSSCLIAKKDPRTSKRMASTGRTPLAKRTNSDTRIQTFRRSLVSSRGTAGKASNTQLSNDKKDDSMLAKHKSSVSFGSSTTTGKENGLSTTSASQNSGLNSLRRTLRATVSPAPTKQPSTTQTNAKLPPRTPGSFRRKTNATIPTSSASTPGSLLKNEMAFSDVDESLLFSPAPPKQTALLSKPVEQPKQAAKLPIGGQRSGQTMRQTMPETNNKQKPSNGPVQVKEPKSTPFTATLNLKSAETNLKPPPTTIDSSKEFTWSQAVPDVLQAKKDPSSTPFTPRGVCMDLSSMFQNAESIGKPPSSRLTKMPPTKARSVRRRPPPTPAVPETGAPADEDWAEKQCESFSKWLNYTFQPNEDKEHEASMEEKQGGSEDRVALRTLVLHQRMAQARIKALEVFQGDEMQNVRNIIYSEITRGRIKLRKERDLYADLTLRNQITSLLLSYSTPWLRLGLETLYGETIMSEVPHHFSPPKDVPGTAQTKKSNKVPLSRMKFALKSFIVQRVLSDDQVLAKYTKGLCKVPSGNFEKKYRAEMRTLVLYRLLVLFFFLDRAKEENILDKAPMLFTKDAVVKSSRELLLAFSRDFLSAEGDFVKHLSRVGLKVRYKQEPIDELNFAIKNLAVDLRDGVRLARMTEILTGAKRKSILALLRLPAVSRLQKLHNVTLVLKKLREFGVPVPEDIAAHHIVDGHREMVLKLMWSVVAHCCLKDLLNVEKVEAEISRIGRAKTDRSCIHDSENEALRRWSSGDEEDRLKSLLLRWCQAVCGTFSVRVRDLTSDFADGRAVCLLIHYYHPSLLRMDEIRSTSRDSIMSTATKSYSLEQVRENERFNSTLANNRMSELGGIPQMVPISDTSSIPDEKSIILCLSFMCSRLLESSTEIRACIAIQACYRKHRRAIDLERKRSAAAMILKTWRANKSSYYESQRRRFALPVKMIESFVLANQSRLRQLSKERRARESTDKAAVLIQKFARMYSARLVYLKIVRLHRSAKGLQRWWRATFFLLKFSAATMVQRVWRGFRVRHGAKKSAAVTIQCIWRGFWAQLQYQIDLLDIITVQCVVRKYLATKERALRLAATKVIQRAARRMVLVQEENRHSRSMAAIKVQTIARRNLAIQLADTFRIRGCAALSIQTEWRRYASHHRARRMQLAARLIQTCARRCLARRRFCVIRHSSIQIQSFGRRCLARQTFNSASVQILICQKAARMWLAKHYTCQRRTAVLLLQCFVRRASARRLLASYKRAKQRQVAVTHMQCFVRRSLARRLLASYKRELESHNAAILIQCFMRRTFARKLLASHKRAREWQHAAIRLQCFVRKAYAKQLVVSYERARNRRNLAAKTVQRYWRMVCSLMRQREENEAVVVIQRHYRGHLVRREVLYVNSCATLIQKVFRGYRSRLEFRMDLVDIVLVQSVVRRWRAEREYRRCRKAILLLQAVGRRIAARKQAVSLKEQRLTCDAVSLIQSRVRGLIARRVLYRLMNAHHQQNSATTIQSFFRGCIARRSAHTKKLLRATLSIQCAFRGYISRRTVFAAIEARRTYMAATLVQSQVRGFVARRVVDRAMEERRQQFSASSIQSLVRLYLARRLYAAKKQAHLEHLAACRIQKTWRCYTVHVDFLLSILAAIKIQSQARKMVAQADFRLKIAAASVIHRVGRAYLGHKLTLQAQFELQTTAALILQRVVRGYLCRIELEVEHFAAMEIQRIWRGYDAWADFLWALVSVTKIQSLARMSLAKSFVGYRLLENKAAYFLEGRSARIIQHAFRRHLNWTRMDRAARKLQCMAKMYSSKLAFSRLRRATALFQSIFRAHLVRARRPKNIRVQAARIRSANCRAKSDPKLILGNRTQAALEVLQQSTRLAEIMTAICTLEIATRLSGVCCAAFAEAGAPDILFSLIRTCNRSLPHVELLHYILLTMSNVSQYEDLLPSIATLTGVEVFLDLVQMFRDKDAVFVLAVSLLEQVVRFSEDFQILCSSRENLKRLKGVHALCVRKLSISGSGRLSMSRESLAFNSRQSRGRQSLSRPEKKFVMRRRDPPSLKQGVRTLQRIINLVDSVRE